MSHTPKSSLFPFTTIFRCCSIDDCRCAIEYMTQPCERQLICTYTEVIGLGQQRINSQDQCPDRITTIVACCSIDDCRCAIEYMTQPCERQLICTYKIGRASCQERV